MQKLKLENQQEFVIGGYRPAGSNGIDALLVGYSPDADFVNVGGYRWKGRVALQKNHAYMHGTIAADDRSDVTGLRERHGAFRESTWMFTNIDVNFPTPNVAIAHATWRLTGHAVSGVTDTTDPRTGIMIFVLIRNGDLSTCGIAKY